MRGYYSAQALYKLVSWPVTSRFADHLSAVTEPPSQGSDGGQHYSSSPIHHGTVCNLFPFSPLCGHLIPHDTQERTPAVPRSADHRCGRDIGGR